MILIPIAFLVLAAFWAVAEVVYPAPDKTPKETNKFYAAVRFHTGLLWLVFGVLSAVMMMSHLFWTQAAITLATAFVALIQCQILRGKATSAPEKFTKLMRPIRFFMLLSGLFMAIITALSNFALKKWGVNPADLNAGASEDFIRHMVQAGEIDTTEQEMIENIFDFDDTPVLAIGTHRLDIEAFEVDASRDEVIKTIVDTEYSRYPVYEESIDNIIGILHVKDILKHIFTEKDLLEDFNLRNHIQPAHFVIESKKNDELFEEFKKAKVQIAIVVDEYGGCSGLVTMEDLLEEIVGKIYDETDDVESPEIEEIGEGRFMFAGATGLDEAAETLGLALDDLDYETIGGFLVHLLERIPGDGEQPSAQYMGYNFQAYEVSDRRIHWVFAEKLEKEPEDDAPDS